MKLLLVLCLFCPAVANAAAPQAPPLRPCPPQAPPLRPDPSEKTELRLYNGVIYEVPVGTHWDSTPNFKVLHRIQPTAPLTQSPFCPDGRCNLPNR